MFSTRGFSSLRLIQGGVGVFFHVGAKFMANWRSFFRRALNLRRDGGCFSGWRLFLRRKERFYQVGYLFKEIDRMFFY
jgi:hypothetical protein